MWTSTDHFINAAMWATAGAYVIGSNVGGSGIPLSIKLAGLAVAYSYGTDYLMGYSGNSGPRVN
jgi:hypothetical protein